MNCRPTWMEMSSKPNLPNTYLFYPLLYLLSIVYSFLYLIFTSIHPQHPALHWICIYTCIISTLTLLHTIYTDTMYTI